MDHRSARNPSPCRWLATFLGSITIWLAGSAAALPTSFVHSGYVAEIPIEEPFLFYEPKFRVAVDADGNSYVAGVTQGINTADEDVFVAKVNAAGTALEWIIQIGGNEDDVAGDIAVDATGAAYVTGWTASDENSFPVVGGPDLSFNGGTDAFVAKIRPDGSGLEYCGYIGGSGSDRGHGIALQDLGDGVTRPWIGGVAGSDATTFPLAVGPSLTFGGGADAFIASVDPTGSGLDSSGYLGGSGFDGISGIAFDSQGRLYLGGSTSSYDGSFPATTGPDLTLDYYYGGFAARLDPATMIYDYAGFIDNVTPLAIAVDSSGHAYLTGFTDPYGNGLPLVVGPDLTFNDDNQGFYNDAFVIKVSADGSGFVYSGFIGGDSLDVATDIAVDDAGSAYVVGQTLSTEATFPVGNGPDPISNFDPDDFTSDAFIVKVATDGSGFDYGSFIGGDNADRADGVALDTDRNPYVAGATRSLEDSFPLLIGPYLIADSSVPLAGGSWSFLTKLSADPPEATLTPAATSTPTSTPTLTSSSTLTPTQTPTSPFTGTPTPTPDSDEPGDSLCPPTPEASCMQAPAGILSFRRSPGDPRKRWFSYRWRHGSTALPQFGNPVTGATGYALCLYDNGQLTKSYAIEAQGTCHKKKCWRKAGRKALQYNNRQTNPDGMKWMRLREGQGRASIRVVGRGSNLILPTFASEAITVQVAKDAASGPECWQSSFSATPVNDASRFRAKLP